MAGQHDHHTVRIREHHSESSHDHGHSVVMDNGSGWMKAGFNSDASPRVIFPTITGWTQPRIEDKSFLLGDIKNPFVGSKVLETPSCFASKCVRYPIVRGIVQDWAHMERVWNHLYKYEMKLCTDEHAAMLGMAPLTPTDHLSKAAVIHFEQYNVPAMYVASQAKLALYASGLTTGCVLDSGFGVTHAVSVFEGALLPTSVQRLNVAGSDLDQYLAILLKKKISGAGSHPLQVAKQVKEQYAFAANDFTAALKSDLSISFTLPDGKAIEVGKEAMQCAELLFQPSLHGRSKTGVHTCIHKAIAACDTDIQHKLYSNIVCAGGTSLIRNFSTRLQKEMCALAPDGPSPVKVLAPANRAIAPWVGGTVLAQLRSFQLQWHTRGEYNEYGSNILMRKH